MRHSRILAKRGGEAESAKSREGGEPHIWGFAWKEYLPQVKSRPFIKDVYICSILFTWHCIYGTSTCEWVALQNFARHLECRAYYFIKTKIWVVVEVPTSSPSSAPQPAQSLFVLDIISSQLLPIALVPWEKTFGALFRSSIP